MPYVVLAVETVPDSELWQPPPPKPRARKKVDVFPPLYAHRPIVIGMGFIDDALTVHHLGALADDNEAVLIKTFTEWFAQQNATLVMFSGREFILPVFNLRGLRHGIPQYVPANAHIDLMEAFAVQGDEKRNFSLDTLTRVIGLGGKNGVDGSMVNDMYANKQIDRIKGYCLCDVARISFLLFRYLLLHRQISVEAYRAAATALFAKCTEMGLTGVTFAADQKRLLLQEG